MAEHSEAAARLADTVREFASVLVSALKEADHRFDLLASVAKGAEDPMAVAAVRVLGADVLVPCTLLGNPMDTADLTLLESAIALFPPAPGASATSEWTHWGMREALRRVSGGSPSPEAQLPETLEGPQPDVGWVATDPWQRLAGRVAQTASLAVPALGSELSVALTGRPVDLGRGFVRAVRRRDWLQAAGVGRWLAMAQGVPPSLGLDTGLEFVRHMGGTDARVALHIAVAQRIREKAHS
jgi:hypothetical protein